MRARLWIGLSVLLSLASHGWAGPAEDAIAAYKGADYPRAIPLLRAAVAAFPDDPLLNAAFLSALVYESHVDEAAELAEKEAAKFPQSPEVIAARGEFAFYMGDMGQAEALYRQAIKLKEPTARAVFGLYRLYLAASMYRTGRLNCLRAHQIDPDDALITLAYIRYLVPEKRREIEPGFLAAHPWLMTRFERESDNLAEVRHEIKGRKVFEPAAPPAETTLPLHNLLSDPRRARGVGLDVSINGGRPLRLLLDTGASGIVIKQDAVDRAGLQHLGSFESGGVGDGGTRASFLSIADTCSIGGLKYQTCLLHSLEGKGRNIGDEDGLIGADVFSAYLIEIDFQNHTLHLTPQPERPPNAQGYDREIPTNENGFTRIFRFGHELMVPTNLNGKSWGLFLIDTGAGVSSVDSTFARLSTKIHSSDYTRIRGVSGNVNDVFEADKAELQFSRFKQRNLGLTAFNLNTFPGHQESRMCGILGIPVLSLFRLTLDYRNGLVNFDYVLK